MTGKTMHRCGVARPGESFFRDGLTVAPQIVNFPGMVMGNTRTAKSISCAWWWFWM